MKRRFGRPTLAIAVILAIALSCLGLSTARAMDYASQLVDTYYRVQDEVLFPTGIGRHYIDLYYYFSNETWQISLAHPQVMNDAWQIFIDFEPPLRALVEGRGGEVSVTEEMVSQVEGFLDLLHQYASPEFQTTIRLERSRILLSSLIGLSFDEGRLLLLGPPEANPPGAPPTRMPMPILQ
ncbi:MAG: hypothetical protein WAW06_03595 [bacterium]